MRKWTVFLVMAGVVSAAVIVLSWSHKKVEGEIIPLEQIVVTTQSELIEAVKRAKPGTAVWMEDGVYRDVQLDITAKGSKEHPIVIAAKQPGNVYFSGDVKVVISGDHIVLRGIYFKDGARDPSQWRSHGPGLVAIYGDYNRVTQCAFHHFDEADSAWITTHVRDGKPAMYNRIDHNSFTDKVTFDQVINLNNTENKNQVGQPMYNRIDHNYFSNPPKKGNAGGGIRVGYFIHDTGRSLIDNNLFERQDSEPEIVTSKSKENVYLYNTIRNSQGTLNFRHGSDQVAIGNYFIADDTSYGYGGMFVWGQNHTIAGNYFSLTRTMKDRGEAALYLNPGHPDSEHSLAFNILLANNIFSGNNGYAIHFHALLERRRQNNADEKNNPVQIPHHITLVNNVFQGDEAKGQFPLFKNDFASETNDTWKNNTYSGATAGVNIGEGLRRDNRKQPDLSKGSQVKVTTSDEMKQAFKDVFDIDLDALANEPILNRKPATFHDVGPAWLTHNPSAYADKGIMSEELKASMERVEKRRQ